MTSTNPWAAWLWRWVWVATPVFLVCLHFVTGELSSWDLSGHVLAARHQRDVLFPHLCGWNAQDYGGYPQGCFYPPLFHWLAGGLGRVVDLDVVFRALVVASLAGFPLALHHALRTWGLGHRLSWAGCCIGTAAWMFPKGISGGDVEGTLRIGLVTQGAAVVLWLLHLASLRQVGRGRLSAGSSLLLAAVVMTHAVVGAAAAAVAGAQACFVAWRRGWRGVAPVLLGIGAAMLLSAVFWVPVLTLGSYQQGHALSLSAENLRHTPPLAQGLFLVVPGLLVLTWWRGRKRHRVLATPALAVMVVLGVLLLVPLAAGSVDATARLFQARPVHSYRLLGAWFIFAALALVPLLPRWSVNPLVAVTLLVGGGFCVKGTMALRDVTVDLPALLPQEDRILAHVAPWTEGADVAPHMLPNALSARGHLVGNGLFVESAGNGPAMQTTMAELFQHVFAWGVPLLPLLPSSAPAHLRALGITTVVANRAPLLPVPLPNQLDRVVVPGVIQDGAARHPQQFHVVRLEHPFAQLLSRPARGCPHAWELCVDRAWVEEGRAEDVTVEGPVPPGFAPALPGETVDVRMEDDATLVLDIHAQGPRLVAVRSGYFPWWHAQDASGARPVLRAAPSTMVVGGQGRVLLRFERPAWLTALEWLAVFIAVALGVRMVWPRRRA